MDNYKAQIHLTDLYSHFVKRILKDNRNSFEIELLEVFNEKRQKDMERRLEYDFLMGFRNLRN